MGVFGAACGQPSTISLTQLMLKNHAVIGYWFSAWMARPDRVGQAIHQLIKYVASGHIKVVVISLPAVSAQSARGISTLRLWLEYGARPQVAGGTIGHAAPG